MFLWFFLYKKNDGSDSRLSRLSTLDSRLSLDSRPLFAWPCDGTTDGSMHTVDFIYLAVDFIYLALVSVLYTCTVDYDATISVLSTCTVDLSIGTSVHLSPGSTPDFYYDHKIFNCFRSGPDEAQCSSSGPIQRPASVAGTGRSRFSVTVTLPATLAYVDCV